MSHGTNTITTWGMRPNITATQSFCVASATETTNSTPTVPETKMARLSKIQWCDGTINFWEGCEKVSPGCKFCYAEDRDRRYHDGKHWGRGAPRKKSVSAIDNIRKFNRWAADGRFFQCSGCGLLRWWNDECCGHPGTGRIMRPKFFVMSLGDIFDDDVPLEWLAEALVEILKADSLDLMVLTKRITTAVERIQRASQHMTPAQRERVLDWMEESAEPPANFAIGATVECQDMAVERLDALTAFPAARRFVSGEPLLDARWAGLLPKYADRLTLVIIGGESGNQARPMHPEWPLLFEGVCDGIGLPIHFKQWGTWVSPSIVPMKPGIAEKGNALFISPDGTVSDDPRHGHPLWRAGKNAAGHSIDSSGRTRTELLTFPSQPWKLDWFKLADHPLGPRVFPGMAPAQEFMAANPAKVGTISRLDKLPDVRPI